MPPSSSSTSPKGAATSGWGRNPSDSRSSPASAPGFGIPTSGATSPLNSGANPRPDPSYFSTPYVACRVVSPGGEVAWVGFLLHNPWPTFMETPGFDDSRVFVSWQRTNASLVIGAEGGTPDLWILRAPDLVTLTRRLQHLVGETPRPPRWALGYHQSRWGYGGHDDLLALDAEFERHEIPCDGLWLDLDYMRGYRIFEVDAGQFPDGVAVTAKALQENGRVIVPIIDPGIKREPGLELYEEALAGGHLCMTEEGKPFVGLVWPGETVFPDFTQPATRDWWARKSKDFLKLGFAGAWLDMNDPSTGPVDPEAMRFRGGQEPHAAHRNQYALGMQMATHAGFLQAKEEERPFLLSRSGFVGSSRFCAIWTGDNLSNRFYLRTAIPTGIGLSISGLPFHGMDVGGFGDSCDDDLMEDWMKLAFLFPLCRNHANNGTRRQEPFAYPKATMEVIRRYIRLRYKLIPYLNRLWENHEQTGDPLLRPVIYHYDEPGAERLDDQFLIGDAILQAPFVADEKTRSVTLPGDRPWYETDTGKWHPPGTITARRRRFGTPLYIREGGLIPMRPGTPRWAYTDLLEQNVHLFVPSDWTGETTVDVIADDGQTIAYRWGEETTVRLHIVGVDGNLAIQSQILVNPNDPYDPIKVTLVFHAEPKSVRIGSSLVVPERSKVTLTDRPLPVWTVPLALE
ncbi:MAG: hypothetical protein C4320_05405 [Armatimonadota bacterium]